MRTVLVSASNDNFLPLAKGLWLSILDLQLGDDVALGWVDIGDADRTRHWLEENVANILVRRADPAVEAATFPLAAAVYHRALLLRPHLPEIFPDADLIVWVDSDAWVQDATSIDVLRRAATRRPDSIAICPVLDVAYDPLFSIAARFVEDNITSVWEALYGADVADEFRWRPLFSAGVFALATESKLWTMWRDECRRLYAMSADLPENIVHVAEQTALNYLAHTTGNYVALEAKHNFHANIGALVRDAQDQVVTPPPVERRVGIVHLSDIVNRGLVGQYLQQGLLYRRGDYLDAGEREALLGIRRT